MTSVAEAMNLGVKLGIDPKVLKGYVRPFSNMPLSCSSHMSRH